MFLHFTTLRVAQDDAPGHSEGTPSKQRPSRPNPRLLT